MSESLRNVHKGILLIISLLYYNLQNEVSTWVIGEELQNPFVC